MTRYVFGLALGLVLFPFLSRAAADYSTEATDLANVVAQLGLAAPAKLKKFLDRAEDSYGICQARQRVTKGDEEKSDEYEVTYVLKTCHEAASDGPEVTASLTVTDTITVLRGIRFHSYKIGEIVTGR